MVWVLSIVAAFMLFTGFYDLATSKTAMQQIVGMLDMVIAAILFSTVAIMETIKKLKNKTVDELAEYRNIPKDETK